MLFRGNTPVSAHLLHDASNSTRSSTPGQHTSDAMHALAEERQTEHRASACLLKGKTAK